MKSLLFLLLLSTITFGQTIQDRVNKFDKPKDYTVRYDKFQKRTEIEFKSSIKTRTEWLSLNPIIWVKDGGEFDTAVFIVSSTRRDLYNYETMRLLVDGELIELKSTDIDYIIAFPVTAAFLHKIAKAKTVEMQLGLFESKFDDKTLLRFKNLASLAN